MMEKKVKKNKEGKKIPQQLEHTSTDSNINNPKGYINLSGGVESALDAQRLEQLPEKQCLHRLLGSTPEMAKIPTHNSLLLSWHSILSGANCSARAPTNQLNKETKIMAKKKKKEKTKIY